MEVEQPNENGMKSKKSRKSKKNQATEFVEEKKPDEKKASTPEVEPSVENAIKVNVGKNMKQNLISENAYISGLMSIINFPKREDSDDDGVVINNGKKKMLNKKGGAQSVQELRQRLKAKLESLQGPKSDKPGKKKKLSKEEKKAKMLEEKRLQSKLAKMAGAAETTKPN